MEVSNISKGWAYGLRELLFFKLPTLRNKHQERVEFLVTFRITLPITDLFRILLVEYCTFSKYRASSGNWIDTIRYYIHRFILLIQSPGNRLKKSKRQLGVPLVNGFLLENADQFGMIWGCLDTAICSTVVRCHGRHHLIGGVVLRQWPRGLWRSDSAINPFCLEQAWFSLVSHVSSCVLSFWEYISHFQSHELHHLVIHSLKSNILLEGIEKKTILEKWISYTHCNMGSWLWVKPYDVICQSGMFWSSKWRFVGPKS